ncbi:MAG: MOSC domain-containing protein [Motiliproteus sp.]
MAIIVSELFFYPLKSARGLSIDQAQLDRFGICQDRRWMLVDDSGVFVTQRKTPRLALVDVLLEENNLTLSVAAALQDYPTLRLTTPTADSHQRRVQVWNDCCDALDAGNEAADWFSGFLRTSVRLVYMPDSTQRQVDLEYAKEGDVVSFADGFPLLLTTQASLDDLNQRLLHTIDISRFRPNVVASGSAPFAEDQWRKIRIGGVYFQVAKPCERCIMTTVDRHTGTKGKEPLATLSKFRRINNKVLFGQNLIHLNQGTIHRGDKIEVLE